MSKTTPKLQFFASCVPPSTTAQQKGAFSIPGGGVRFFKKKKAVQAEKTWWALLQPHAPIAPFDGPVSLSVHLTYPWRKTEKKRVIREYSMMPIETRPDVENVFKMLGDVMTTLQFFHDDSQIAVLTISKHYGDRPGIGVSMTSIGGYHRTATAQPEQL